MAWVKLDDGFFNNQKIVSVSKDAKIIYLAALCHAGATLSDGFIPRNAVAILAAQADVRATGKAVNELTAARLWKPSDGGFTIHDYLEHNTSSEDVHAKREQARIRMEQRRSREVPANKSRTSQEVNEKFAYQNTETEIETEITTSSDVVGGADAPAKPKAKRATQVPESFAVTDALAEWGRSQDRPFTKSEMEAQVPRFIDHYRGKGQAQKDWHRTFQNWMRNALDFGHLEPRPQPRSSPARSTDKITSVDELFAQGADDEPTGYSEDFRDSPTSLAGDRPRQGSDSGVDTSPGRNGLRVIASRSG